VVKETRPAKERSVDASIVIKGVTERSDYAKSKKVKECGQHVKRVQKGDEGSDRWESRLYEYQIHFQLHVSAGLNKGPMIGAHARDRTGGAA